MQLGLQNGVLSVVLRVKIRKLSDGTPYTTLDHTTSGLNISVIADNEPTTTSYTVAGSTIETITTLGTYAAPTATKCRFKAVDATNHPGLYEIQLADARWAVSNARSVNVTVSGVSDIEQVDTVIQLGMVTTPNFYPDDCVLLDPVGGTSGTTVGTNGTSVNPSDTFANAATIATARGKKRIKCVPGASFALITGTYAGFEVDLNGGALALNQNVAFSGTKLFSSVFPASVDPDTERGQNTVDLDSGLRYENLVFNSAIRAANYCYLKNCVIGTSSTPLTFTIDGDNSVDPVYLQDCYTSKISGLTFSCSGGADLILNGWYGDFTITNLAAGTTVLIYGYAKVTIDASCTGGTVRHTSHVEITNNGSATLDLVSEPLDQTILVSTTIATLATQTSFTLTAGSADNDAYNGCYAIITDQVTNLQKGVVSISDYVGSTKTVTLGAAAPFTVATGDSITVVAVNLSGTTVGSLTDVAAALANKLADVILRRTRTSVQASANGEAVDVSSLYGFLGQAQKSSRSGATLTVKNADGTTLGTLTLTQDAAANPITGVN